MLSCTALPNGTMLLFRRAGALSALTPGGAVKGAAMIQKLLAAVYLILPCLC